MGPRFAEDDHLISSLLDLANLRFAPMKSAEKTEIRDGIVEMAYLQSKFKIFSEEHSLGDSFAVLGLGGFWNPALKSKLYKFLDRDLAKCSSDTGEEGNRRVVSALIENFAQQKPSPVFFTVHEGGKEPRVEVKRDKPLVYMDDIYLIISLPMTPWRPGSRAQ